MEDFTAPKATFDINCFDLEGNLRWTECVRNLVTTAGKTDLLNQYFSGSAYTATWYAGLKNLGTAVITDTMALHPSWTENTSYSNSTRPQMLFSAAAAGVISTSNTPSFTMNASTTIYGMFTTSNSAIGGTSGTLYNVADFSTPRSTLSGDVIIVSVTLTVS